MGVLIANYKEPREAFAALMCSPCNHRILLMRGEPGSGKTTLLQHFCERVEKPAARVPIQLRGSTVNVAEIFSRIGQSIKWDRLPRFTEKVAELEGKPNIKVDKNWLAGINNRINVTLRVENQLDRDERHTALTDAWFEDMAVLNHPVVIVFDTYNEAPSEVQNWIEGPFLARAAGADPIRVVIAGREVPNKNNIEWGSCCQAHDLFGVEDAQHWMPLVEAMRRRVDVRDPQSWLAGICHVLKGNPGEIMKVIEKLPKIG